MTHRQFIEMQHIRKNEFAIFFKEDTYPVWEEVKVVSVSEEGCELEFTKDQPPVLDPIYVPSPAGETLAYTWEEVNEEAANIKEI
ncbi:hypothetical protein VPHD51_0172 [Vibrio phage D51]